jgi:hypothetical protein
MVHDKYGVEVTPERWLAADFAIKSFIRKYPLHWMQFRKDIEANKSEYQLAKEGDLKKSGFRNTLSFPVAYRRLSEAEKLENPQGTEIELLESLKHTLEDILPGFTAPDENVEKAAGGKQIVKNKLYREFIRRYSSLFQPGEKF